jgi:hypothetical protein
MLAEVSVVFCASTAVINVPKCTGLQTLEAAKIAALESARVTLSPSSTILSQASQPPRSNQSPRAEACQEAEPLVLPLYHNRNSGPSSGQGGAIPCQQGALPPALAGGWLRLLHASGPSLLGITKTCRSAPKQSAVQRYFLEARETHRVPKTSPVALSDDSAETLG